MTMEIATLLSKDHVLQSLVQMVSAGAWEKNATTAFVTLGFMDTTASLKSIITKIRASSVNVELTESASLKPWTVLGHSSADVTIGTMELTASMRLAVKIKRTPSAGMVAW